MTGMAICRMAVMQRITGRIGKNGKLKESAVSYAERVDKPILILHGMDDYRTPIEGAHQFYVAIKDLHPDLPVKMVAYPHTGHEQPTDPRLLKHYYHEMILWFEKYL